MKELIIKVDEEKMDIEGNAPVVDRPQELVRCKDCKHVCMCDSTEMFPDIPVYAKCTLTDQVHEPKWFCADGERR